MVVHETGLDRHHLGLSPQQWDEFNRTLDAHPKPDPHLVKLMARPQRIQTNRSERAARIKRLFDEFEAE